MRHWIFTLFILLISTAVFGQSPEGFTYQAVARDASGEILANQNVGLRISILQGSISGSSVFTETHTATSNSFGLINLVIGQGMTSDSFTTIDWSTGPYFVKIEMDPAGGNSYVEFGTSQLLSVPYAMHSKTTENTFSGDYTDLMGTPTIPTNLSELNNDTGFINDPADADSDPANEIQDISLVGAELSITDGSTVDLSGLPGGGSETDPEVGTNTLNYLPRWDGSALVTSNIFDNGKIGIGNSDPTEILHITSTGVPNIRVEAPGDNGFYIGFNVAGYMAFSTVHSGTSYFDAMILKEGKLGIGNTDPLTKLDVGGVVTATGGNSDQWNEAFSWGNHADAGYLTSAGAETDPEVGANTLNYLSRWDGAALISSSIIDNGNVGIGLASPDHLLSVAGMIQSTVDGFKFPDGTVQTSASSTGSSHFLDAADGSPTQALYVDNDGKVGIGTVTPLDELHVVGNIHGNGGIFDGNVDVAEDLNTGENLSIGGDLAATSGSFSGNLNAAGLIDGSTANFGNLEVGPGLTFTGGSITGLGDLDLNISGLTTVNGDFATTGGLNVEGDIQSTSGSLSVAGDIAAGGSLSAGGDMVAIGGTFLADIDVTGAIRLGSAGPELHGKNARLGVGTNNPVELLHLVSDFDPNIKVDGPGNSGYYIGYNGAGYMAFSTRHSGTPYWETLNLREGKVGIGTTSPVDKLHVNGSLRLGVGNYVRTDGTNSFLGLSGGDGWISTGAIIQLWGTSASAEYANSIRFLNNGGEAMRIAGPSGNVGIGTVSPSTKLDVNGVINTPGGNSDNWNTAFGWGDHDGLYRPVDYVPTLSEVLIEGSTAGGGNIIDLADPVNAQDAATKAYVDASGGDLTLPYNGGDASDNILFSITNSGTGVAGWFTIDNVISSGRAIRASTNGIGEAGHFRIFNPSSTGNALYAGTDGIGNAGYFEGKLSATDLIESVSGGFKFPDGSIQTTASFGGSSNSLDAADGSPAEAVYVDNNGNVGIGTTNPGEVLDVSGTVKAIAFISEGPIPMILEGATADDFELTITTDPTADHTLILPDATGTVLVAGTASIDDLSDGNTGGGTGNLFLGHLAGTSIETAVIANTGLGYEAMSFATAGHYNTAVGYYSLRNNTSGEFNTGIGDHTLQRNSTGSFNTASGAHALFSNDEGSENTASGYQALYFNVTGNHNTATGYHALYTNTSGGFNTAHGFEALKSNTTGFYNTAIGTGTLFSNTDGRFNTASGLSALYSNTSGYYNTASGRRSMYSNSTGYYNTASGVDALYYNTTAHFNTAMGYESLHQANRVSDMDGYNTAIGGKAGNDVTTGQFNLILGAEADVSAGNAVNQIVIGYGAIGTGDNQIALGNTSINAIKGQVNFTTYSDMRIKRDIRGSDLGLNFVNKLRPVKYRLINPADYPEPLLEKCFEDEVSKRPEEDETVYDGLIAQEVKAVLDELGVEWSGWSEDDITGKQGIQYGALVVPLIKAVQELTVKVNKLEQQLNHHKETNTKLTKK